MVHTDAEARSIPLQASSEPVDSCPAGALGANQTVTEPSEFVLIPGAVLAKPTSFWSVSNKERVWLSYTWSDQKSFAGIGPGSVILYVFASRRNSFPSSPGTPQRRQILSPPSTWITMSKTWSKTVLVEKDSEDEGS